MPRLKIPSPAESREMRRQLHEDIVGGGLPVAETVRRMRAALGMTQQRFGQLFKLTPRQVWELEHGRANPTTETLARLGRPFGFAPGFVKARSEPDGG
jgi:DNA-binding XRE family transcriptional regulator